MRLLISAALLALCAIGACRPEEVVDKVPVIKALEFGPQEVRGGSGEDTVYLSFRFRDGDADLGIDPASGDFDVYLTDSRDSSVRGYYLPEIPADVGELQIPLEGTTTILLEAALILPRPDSLHQALGDTLRFSYYLRDRAGNKSEVLTTPDLILTP